VGDRPSNKTTNVSETVTRLISRQARRGTPTVVGGALVPGSTDLAGEVNEINVVAGDIDIEVTYANPYQPPAPIVIISPSSADAANVNAAEFYVSDQTTTGFVVSALDVSLDGASFTYAVYETGFINPSSTKLT